MSLDLSIFATRPTCVFDANITHNLARMARECGLYEPLWRSEGARAGDLIVPVSEGVAELVLRPEKYREFNPENGWGDYENLVEFARAFLAACMENPDGDVMVSR